MSETAKGTLADLLPAVYGPRLPDFFEKPAITEKRATCDDCAMCDKGAPAANLETTFFRPDVKCCSYHPTLPNYLAGSVLEDESLATGRARLRAKMTARIGVTPQWLAAPRKYLVLLDAARESSFGRSEALRCPYYEVDGGTCSIWRHREGVCTTFFCKHEGGASGHRFWTTLRRYLIYVERSLARYAANSVAPDLVEPNLPRNRLTIDDLEDRAPGDQLYARYWGGWLGREEEFYVECARRVRALGRDDFAKLLDDEAGRAILSEVTDRYHEVMEPRLLPRLTLNPDMLVNRAAEGVGVTTYSRYDSLLLTDALYEALGHFTGNDPVETVLERLRTEHDLDLPPSLLLYLQQYDVVRG